MKLKDVIRVKSPKKSKVLGYTLFEGKSRINGAPIVGIITLNSANIKTGNMAQVWILDSQSNPIKSIALGNDISVCGMCQHRKSLGGACYVNVGNAPLQVYNTYKLKKYPFLDKKDYNVLNGLYIRFGAYGDPAALPMVILANLKAVCVNNTSYTHQWQYVKNDALKSLSMASVDTLAEAKKASAKGWRYFRVANENSTIQKNEIVCPNITSGINCIDCGLCSGNKIKAKNIVIPVHGTWKKNFKGD